MQMLCGHLNEIVFPFQKIKHQNSWKLWRSFTLLLTNISYNTNHRNTSQLNWTFVFQRLTPAPVVAQYYEADVNKEHVIRGNAAIVKCLIPSFVADFVDVVSWETDQGDVFYPSADYGSFIRINYDLICSFRSLPNNNGHLHCVLVAAIVLFLSSADHPITLNILSIPHLFPKTCDISCHSYCDQFVNI